MQTEGHITLFVPALYGGGAERVMVTIANELSKRHVVDLVVNRAEGAYVKDVAERVTIYEIGAPYLFASVPALAGYLRKYEPDALLSTMDSANLVSIWAAQLARVKTKVVIRIPNTMSRRTEDYDSLRYKLIPELAKRCYSYADEIIAISNGVATDLSHITGIPTAEMSVIYNPVVDDELLLQAQADPPHPWFTDDVPVVLGVGRLVNQKDFSTLIRAHARLSERVPHRLLILGEGDNRDDLERLTRATNVENSVSLPGFVDNPYSYMNSADVFVLSSAWEGFGNVLVEAMACGTPVVATDCESGPAEIVEYGAHGPLVPVGDEKRLAGAMNYVLDNPTDHNQLRDRATDFTTASVVPSYEQLLV